MFDSDPRKARKKSASGATDNGTIVDEFRLTETLYSELNKVRGTFDIMKNDVEKAEQKEKYTTANLKQVKRKLAQTQRELNNFRKKCLE